jgi:Amt family ammonium transporter
LTGVFASSAVGGTAGLVEGNPAQFVNNAIGALLTWVLAAVATFIILKITDALIGVRVSEGDEIQGLDISQHGEEAYQL